MLQFACFGSGSSGNCYYFSTATDTILIDAGVGIRTLKKYFKEYGLSLSSIHHILITHDHADHVKTVGTLSMEHGMKVHATQLVHRGIERNYCIRHKIPADNVCLIEKGVSFRIGSFLITPFGVPHDSMDCVGYCIQTADCTFCLLTDVGHVTPEIAEYIGRADYLVLEANYDEEMLRQGPYPQHLKERIQSGTGHLSNARCAEALAKSLTGKIKKVWLCHLSEENNHPELARKTVESTLRSYGIVPGKDFELDILKRKQPSGIYNLE